jgi:hypothetical protein
MNEKVREDLTDLFGLWLNPQEARRAADEVRAAEQTMKPYPAPVPDGETLNRIGQRMQAAYAHRLRIGHFVRTAAAVAAVILVVATLSRYGLQKSHRYVGLASLIPAALWDSDDLATDDVRLAYLNTEVDHLEAQVRAIEDGEADTNVSRTLSEVEMELFQADTDFWKG